MIEKARNNPPVPGFVPSGVGQCISRLCMGCNKPRMALGSTGTGPYWRCGECTAARAARRAAAAATAEVPA